MAENESSSASANSPSIGGTGLIFRHDRYALVCGLILATIISSSVLGDGAVGLISTLLLVALTLGVTLLTSNASRRVLLIGAGVSLFALVTIAIALVTGNTQPARIAYGVAMLVLVLMTPVVIVQRLLQHRIVTRSTVSGAAAIYLLIGLLFAVIYGLVGTFLGAAAGLSSGEAFFTASRHITASDYFYYSFATLTTVGYGDLTAAVPLGRMLSVCEALIGQLYLVTVVAVLVANMGRDRERPGDASVISLPEDD